MFYGLSDPSLAVLFSSFSVKEVRVSHPNLANPLGALSRVCINIFLFQLRKMLILLIGSHCKIGPLPTVHMYKCTMGT